MICGEPSLVEEAETVVREIVALSRDRAKIARDVREMRDLIEQEKPARDIWDFKLIPGGLIDIEFLAQFLALVLDGAASAATGSEKAIARRAPSRPLVRR